MEDKDLSVDQITNYSTLLKQAEISPVEFLSDACKLYSKEKLYNLFSYFLANSSNIFLLMETIKKISFFKGEKNIDDLIDFLMVKKFDQNVDQNEIVNAKIFCIKAISNYKNKKCIPALLYCLNNKNENYKMRFQAAVALGKIGDKVAVESLINVMADENEHSVYVRESAAQALGMIGDMRAVDPFLSILETKKNFLDKFTFLKERVIESLGKINFSISKRAITAFKNALEDESSQVRINAIESIMNSNIDEAYDIIKTKLFDPDDEVVKNAVIAMYNLRGKQALFEILKEENLPKKAKEEADSIYREYEEDE